MILEELAIAVETGDMKKVQALIPQGLADGVDPQDLLDKGLLAGMAALGARFKAGEVFVPEVLIAARALNAGTVLLKDKLVAGQSVSKGKVVIATVSGDLHDIGKNLVLMMLESTGFEVIDLGVDVPVEAVVEAVRENKPDILAMSALLTTTMAFQKDIVEALKVAGLRDGLKIMIGGAPVTQDFCDNIGADSYSPDAPGAADAALALLS
ncbi:corrinoid methyltransferase [Clostridia bacterium]|nr:corrinoid methyltransferase [Clostridia bacterium]